MLKSRKILGWQIHFCDQHSTWPRGSIDNTHDLICKYLKGSDLPVHTKETLGAIAYQMNISLASDSVLNLRLK